MPKIVKTIPGKSNDGNSPEDATVANSETPPEVKSEPVSETTESATASTPPEVKPEPVALKDLVPLTAEQRELFTRLAYKYGQKHAITTAAAREKFIREPEILDQIASDEQAEVLQLGDLLQPFPDAETLREVNDRRI